MPEEPVAEADRELPRPLLEITASLIEDFWMAPKIIWTSWWNAMVDLGWPHLTGATFQHPDERT